MRSANGRPTIRDVAARAGVSSATVSRVINGGHWVAAETRQAVESAIRATGYTANPSARSLATGRSNSIAFLVTDQHDHLFSDPTFSILVRGAAEVLGRRGKTLVLLVAGSGPERESVLGYVAAGHVDGVMLVSARAGDPMVDSLLQAGVPTVSCGVPLGHEQELSYVAVDEAGSAAEMVRYLRGRGHRRIAMISGPEETPGGRFRLAGFRDELGADFDPDLVAVGDWGVGSGTAAMQELLSVGKPIDAVFCASDAMAVGAIAALDRAGLRVPGDIAVAGFDDSGLAADHDPQITTMRQPWDRIVAEMVATLSEGEPRQTVLPATLVARASA